MLRISHLTNTIQLTAQLMLCNCNQINIMITVHTLQETTSLGV